MNIEVQEPTSQIDVNAFDFQQKSQEPKTLGQELKERIFLEEGETFEDPVLCNCCKGILVEPRNCQKCENYFCKECIEKTAAHNNDRCECGEIYKNEEPHKLINKMLSRLRFICVNEIDGCVERITYENLDSHLCPYERLDCENQFCDQKLFRKDFLLHKKNCPFKQVVCEFCQQNFFQSNLEQHQQICEKKPVECSGCFKTFFLNEFQQHYENCQEVLQTCQKCSKQLKRKQMVSHSEVQCLYYYYLQKEERMNKNLTQLKKTIAYLNNRLVEEEQYFGTKCQQCEKYCCEVSRKVCQICRSIYCLLCSKKKMKNCARCNCATCNYCNTGLDFCKVCANKKKEENEKSNYLSSGRKRSKRGRPRKITNSFIIDQLNKFKLNQNDRQLNRTSSLLQTFQLDRKRD